MYHLSINLSIYQSKYELSIYLSDLSVYLSIKPQAVRELQPGQVAELLVPGPPRGRGKIQVNQAGTKPRIPSDREPPSIFHRFKDYCEILVNCG